MIGEGSAVEALNRSALAPVCRRTLGAGRDEVLRCLQELVDGGLASWWINEAGGTELHFIDGKAFLLQHDGIVCLR
jgi:hypothetical protein